MKVLVTGGAGFIGSHLVDALVEAGHEAVIVDNLATGSQSNLNSKARVYHTSITDYDELRKVIEQERPDIVNHHAAQTSVRHSMADPSYDAQVNIVGSINLLRLCVEFGVKKVLFASTCAAYAPPEYIPMREDHPKRPESAYGLAKHTVENYIRFFHETQGLNYKIFRYGNVYGPRQNPGGEAGVVAIFTGQMLGGTQPTIFGDGKKTRDYIYVGDVVRANMLGMADEGDNDVYNVAGGKEVTDFEIFDAVREATGVVVEPRYAERRPGEASRVSLDCSKVSKVLRWTPTVQLQDGIREVVAHYRTASH
jgi:UDP-glucose 4-epimerase